MDSLIIKGITNNKQTQLLRPHNLYAPSHDPKHELSVVQVKTTWGINNSSMQTLFKDNIF